MICSVLASHTLVLSLGKTYSLLFNFLGSRALMQSQASSCPSSRCQGADIAGGGICFSKVKSYFEPPEVRVVNQKHTSPFFVFLY